MDEHLLGPFTALALVVFAEGGGLGCYEGVGGGRVGDLAFEALQVDGGLTAVVRDPEPGAVEAAMGQEGRAVGAE